MFYSVVAFWPPPRWPGTEAPLLEARAGGRRAGPRLGVLGHRRVPPEGWRGAAGSSRRALPTGPNEGWRRKGTVGDGIPSPAAAALAGKTLYKKKS